MKRLIIIFFSLCMIIMIAPPLFSETQKFDFRSGIPETTDLNRIINNPSEIKFEMKEFHDSNANEDRISGYYDYHGLFDTDFNGVVSILSTPVNLPKYSNKILNVNIEKINGPVITVHFEIGITFLGYRVSYITRMEIVKEKISGDEMLFKTRMLESIDGNLYESYSSWYVKKMVVNGKPMVYIRYFSRQGIRHPFIGMYYVAKLFSPWEMKSMIDRVASVSKT